MKASTLKSEFLADICDGLNNPVLNIIRLAENVVEKSEDKLDALPPIRYDLELIKNPDGTLEWKE